MIAPLRIPKKTCSCGHEETVVPANARLSEDATFGGLYWECVCGSTLILPTAKFKTAREICDCPDCSVEPELACTFNCHEHAKIGELCKGCLDVEIYRNEVRYEIDRITGRR